MKKCLLIWLLHIQHSYIKYQSGFLTFVAAMLQGILCKDICLAYLTLFADTFIPEVTLNMLMLMYMLHMRTSQVS